MTSTAAMIEAVAQEEVGLALEDLFHTLDAGPGRRRVAGGRCGAGSRRDVASAARMAVRGVTQWTRPPSRMLAPLIRMSTRLSRAPLSSVTRRRMSALAATARSQTEPPKPATRPGSAVWRSAAGG